MLRTVTLLCIAAVLGVVGATTSTCLVGLTQGTTTWCGLPLAWPIGVAFAVPVALVLGIPADFAFRRAGLRQWWLFPIGGALLSLPVWYEFAQPFDSPRWQASGLFDTLNYVGTGALAGFAFWWLKVRREARDA